MQNEEDEKDEKTPRERFEALAPNRLKNALHGLKVLGNCANTQSYAYSEGEAEQILEHVGDAYKELIGKFRSEQGQEERTLVLDRATDSLHPSEVG